MVAKGKKITTARSPLQIAHQKRHQALWQICGIRAGVHTLQPYVQSALFDNMQAVLEKVEADIRAANVI